MAVGAVQVKLVSSKAHFALSRRALRQRGISTWPGRLSFLFPLLLALSGGLAGCAALGGQPTTEAVLKDLQGCEREYTVTLVATLSGPGHIVCRPAPPAASADPPT